MVWGTSFHHNGDFTNFLKLAPECPVQCGGGVQSLFGQCPNAEYMNNYGSSVTSSPISGGSFLTKLKFIVSHSPVIAGKNKSENTEVLLGSSVLVIRDSWNPAQELQSQMSPSLLTNEEASSVGFDQ